MWQYVAAPVSPRKTKKCVFFFPLVAMCGNMWRYRHCHGKPKKMTFLKRFSLGGDVWQYVAVPVSPRKTNINFKVTFLKKFSFGGDVWQYVAVPVSPRKQKSDFL